MIPTFITDFPISIFLGTLFSLFRADIEKEDPFYRFYSFWAGFGVWTFYALSSAYAYARWDHWMWLYYLQPPHIAFWGWVLVYFLLYWIPFLTGYLIGAHGRKDSWMSLNASFLISGGSLAGMTYELWDRISVIAPDGNYQSDQAISIFAHAEYREFILTAGGVSLLLIFISWRVARRYYVSLLEQGKITKHLLHPAKRRTLQCLAEVILPEAPDLRPISGKDLPLGFLVSPNLADFNFLNRIIFRLAIDFVNLSPLFYTGRPLRLENLKYADQVKILEKIDGSGIIAIKMPLKLIRMFLLQYYYQDQRVLDGLGYVGESLGIFRKKLRWLNPVIHK